MRRDERIALDSVSLSIAQGEHVAILGPNGCGKSTLIKLISRDLYPVLKPEPWALRILGRDRWRLFDLRHILGARLQRLDADVHARLLRLRNRALRILRQRRHLAQSRSHAGMEGKTREVMELLEISHLAERNTNEMSCGEARRILIARALVHDPQALVLDEPTTSLDLHATHELRETLRKLARNGISIIMVTHHLPDIIPEIARVVLIKEGRIYGDGPKRKSLLRRRSRGSSAYRWRY